MFHYLLRHRSTIALNSWPYLATQSLPVANQDRSNGAAIRLQSCKTRGMRSIVILKGREFLGRAADGSRSAHNRLICAQLNDLDWVDLKYRFGVWGGAVLWHTPSQWSAAVIGSLVWLARHRRMACAWGRLAVAGAAGSRWTVPMWLDSSWRGGPAIAAPLGASLDGQGPVAWHLRPHAQPGRRDLLRHRPVRAAWPRPGSAVARNRGLTGTAARSWTCASFSC